MAYLLSYSRNRSTNVEQTAPDRLVSACRVQDALRDAWVSITVRLPDLEILEVDGGMDRSHRRNVPDIAAPLQKLVGMRVGAGMTKIIKGLVGQDTELDQAPKLMEECCQGVILSLTRDYLERAPHKPEDSGEFFKNEAKRSTRLQHSCVAFQDGSPLMEGVEG